MRNFFSTNLILALFFFIQTAIFAQNAPKNPNFSAKDSVSIGVPPMPKPCKQTVFTPQERIAQAETLLDLQFTEENRDSMLGEMDDYLANYKMLHAQTLENWVSPPLLFEPLLSPDFVNAKQMPIRWQIPRNVPLPKNKNELAFYSIPQLASLLKYKKITSLELTKFFIERLRKWGDTLHCVVSIPEGIALQEARAADEEIATGRYRGILHGIPYGIKDLLSVENTRTTWGAAPYKAQVLPHTATVVEKLRAAGAVLVAKLSLGSLAMGDVWYEGKTRNPWNLEQGASGSSAGSAAATAAGLVPFALGSETWGSIVSPSARCGTVGLRPTFGRVSRYGAMTLSWSLDKIGVISRSAEDAAIVLDAIRGEDGKDRTAKNMTFNYTGKIDFQHFTIAYPKNFFDTIPQTRHEWQTLKTLEKMGAKLKPVAFWIKTPSEIINIILMSEAAAAFDDLTRSRRDTLLTAQSRNDWGNLFRAARFIPAVEYVNANRLRTKLMQEMNDLLRGVDVLVMPNFWANQLAITNLTGHPAVTALTGFDEKKPQSMTFISNLFDEASLLSLVKLFQEATDFHKKHPDWVK